MLLHILGRRKFWHRHFRFAEAEQRKEIKFIDKIMRKEAV